MRPRRRWKRNFASNLNLLAKHFTITSLEGFAKLWEESIGIRYPFEALAAVYV